MSEIIETMKNELEGYNEAIQEKRAEYNDNANEVAEGVTKERKGDMESLVSQYNEQKRSLDKHQDQTDKLEVAAKRLSTGKEKKESPWESIGTTLKDNPEMLEN